MLKKIGNEQQICYADRVVLNGGRGDGLKMIYVGNGKLQFVLCESHALDVVRLTHKGTNIGFLSKNGIYAPNDKFIHTFPAGMLYTCGLDSIGIRKGFEMHGRVHSIPAEIIGCIADEKGVKITAKIIDSALFGENIQILRTIETKFDSEELNITDKLTNLSYRDENYCMLYHINAGFPLVDDGAEIEGDFLESIPRTELAKKNMARMLKIEEPIDNAEEVCYFHRMKSPSISIINRKIQKKYTVSYSDSTLPYLVEWKSLASGDYVIGLEPCTSWMDDKFKYSILKSGESLVNKISISIKDI